jgi:competence protein ComGC
MKTVGILLSLLVSAIVLYLTLQNVRSSSQSADPMGLAAPIEKAKQVQAVIDLSAVQMAVQNYQAQQGSFPKTLSELVASGLLNESQIKKLAYDPETGKVTSQSD